jgi:hypothetical protein
MGRNGHWVEELSRNNEKTKNTSLSNVIYSQIPRCDKKNI